MITRRILGRTVAGSAVWLTAGQAFAQGAAAPATPTGPPTVEELIEIPRLVDAAVSPNGKSIALLNQNLKYKTLVSDDTFNAWVSFRNGDTLAEESVANLGKMEVYSVRWLDDERVLLHVYNTGRRGFGESRGDQAGDGTMVLTKATRNAMYLPPGNVVDLLPKEPDYIMMSKIDRGSSTLYRVSIKDGKATEVERGSPQTFRWFIQDGKAVMRIDRDPKKDDIWVYMGRAPGVRDWTEVGRFFTNSFIGNDFNVLAVSPSKAGVMLVATNAEGENFRPLREFNVNTKAWGDVLSRQNGDATSVVLDPDGDYVATTYIDDTPIFDCKDPQMTAHMTDLSAAFPGASLDIRDVSRDRQRLICRVSGPHNAGSFLFYDRQTAKVGPLGNVRPWLAPERLPTGAKLSARSKDGTPIRAYLTIPVGGGKKPMVVMPHGGPNSRDQIDFDQWAQTLSAKGWYVLQPNFRGSSGQGQAFTHGSKRQWNGVVQEDIEASILAAFAAYPIDPDRIAVCGGSFGGYSSLMSAVRNPGIYKAVVGLAGLYDLDKFLWREKAEGENELPYQYWKSEIGDPVADAEMIKRSSPSQRAREIAAPVLLVHGTSDPIVNVEHARGMASALRAAGKSCIANEIPGMGHGPGTWEEAKNVYEMIARFIDEKFKAVATAPAVQNAG